MNASHSPIPSTEPLHRDGDLVARLQQSEIFRDYQQAFQTATGLPLALRATGAFSAPMQGAKNLNPFCTLMAATSKTCSACLQMQNRVETEAMGRTTTLECFAGLNDSAVPVVIGERVIGYLQTGQVLFRAPTEKQFRAALKQIVVWNKDANAPELHTAFFETRVLTRSHYEAMLRLLSSFAQHLALVANELVIKEAASEPPAVTRARAFIAEKLGEALSLEQVAGAAHMSPFYFCKVFKSATGVTLTDYIARARVEKVKQLLLNPHTRVSEAAYEAGFQSLSQFNRVFRRIAGQAPSAYREHLHGSAEPGRTSTALPFAA
jgi:AraC-like DNA-binding protein